MTMTQIRYFLTVAQELSFSKAAELLYVSQPAISRQMAQLEQELEVRLFDRTNQGVAMTEAGEQFAAFFRDSQRNFQDLVISTRRQSGAVHGSIRMGCTEGWDLSAFFPQLSASLAQRYPDLTLNLSGFNLDHILHALERSEVDVILTNESLLHSRERVSSAVLTRRRGILLFSAQHRLAGKPGLALEDFRDEPFYVTAPPTMKEATIELLSLCADADFLPNIEYVSTLSTAYMKLTSGRGVLLCNDWMMARNNPLFTTLPLHIYRNISLAWLTENHSDLVQLLIRELQRSFQAGDDLAPGIK
jgi:DNA-binding transcriptional LysR family regulator